MKKALLPILATCILLLLGLWLLPIQTSETASLAYETPEGEEGEGDKEAGIRDALLDNFERTKDPALGYPPLERMIPALEKTRRLQAEYAVATSRNTLENNRWKERGPNNIGGRTRTLLFDANDPSRRAVFAGGVAGGLWKTEDITANPPEWTMINDYLENMAIGAIAQDPNDPQVMYLGTGETYGNLDAVAGLGLFKSTDGGKNWTLLEGTLGSSSFRYTQDLLVHPETGDVYAATASGIFRSQDEGLTWDRAHILTSRFFDLIYNPISGLIYASYRTGVLASATGDFGDWDALSGINSGFPGGITRVELTVSDSNPNIMYVICTQSGEATSVYASTNGGETWTERGLPTMQSGGQTIEFTRGQAWYDLDIAVDPTNPGGLIAGGVPIRRSPDGGFNWEGFAGGMHVDQHLILFDKEDPRRILFGNDGGVYYTENGTEGPVIDRNNGYNVTQFYACAIHPEAHRAFWLGGTQDNNSLLMEEFGISRARSVRGGDGAFCHIDEDEPQFQMVSSQFGNYSLSVNEGVIFQGGASFDGSFISPSDYDSETNIMYSQTGEEGGDYYRWRINNGGTSLVDITDFNLSTSTIFVDPNISNRVYFGTFGGQLIRVDNAHEGTSVTGFEVNNFTGTISSIDVERGNPDHILVTISNFGVASVFESKDGGSTWANSEGNLPDMPVRSGIFNPFNPSQAMIATEAGAWITELLDGTNTEWIPPAEDGTGIPLVRTDMLQIRRSDGVILAGTHGRGMFTSDVFSPELVKANFDRIAYTKADHEFYGGMSTQANSYLWEFGDGESSEVENTTHRYENVGEYPVKLTINNSASEEDMLKVLPDVDLPYTKGSPNYGGDFESRTEQYGAYTIRGSAFSRGKSSIAGKNGANSGDNAFVVGIDEEFYEKGTNTMLYLPNFDFSDESIYEFRFYAKYRMQPGGQDGFQVQYSTDRGKSWQQLGSDSDPNWYNFRADNDTDNAAFPRGTSYFAGNKNTWTRFHLDVSSLSGNENVAFRFVFKSEFTGAHIGVAIDDVEVTKYEGELRTNVLTFTGEYTGPTEISLNWTTFPEWKCRKFELERSFNGRDFEKLDNISATGGTTTEEQNYTATTLGQRNLLFYRLNVVNEDPDIDYAEEFYTETIVLRRNFEGVEVFRIFPNPFTSFIELTFTDFVDRPVEYKLFDRIGRLLQTGTIEVNDVHTRIELGSNLPAGVYFMDVRIGDEETVTYKLLGGFDN